MSRYEGSTLAGGGGVVVALEEAHYDTSTSSGQTQYVKTMTLVYADGETREMISHVTVDEPAAPSTDRVTHNYYSASGVRGKLIRSIIVKDAAGSDIEYRIGRKDMSGTIKLRIDADGVLSLRGPAAGPHPLWTIAELQYMGPYSFSHSSRVYGLEGDLDLTEKVGQSWAPIGNSTAPFRGTFDGNHHTLSNLNIIAPSSDEQGLFGCINMATVKNIHVAEGRVEGSQNVGGVVGISTLNALGDNIIACSFSGTVKGANGYVGGVVGNAQRAWVIACRSSGSVEGSIHVGGVAGRVFEAPSGLGVSRNYIVACYSSSVVTGNNNTGGVIGVGGAHACYSSGRVAAIGVNIGGVGGQDGFFHARNYWYNPYFSSLLLAPSGYPQYGRGQNITDTDAAPFGSGGPTDVPGWPVDDATVNWGVYVSGPDPVPYITGSTSNEGKFWKILPGYNTSGDYPRLYWE